MQYDQAPLIPHTPEEVEVKAQAVVDTHALMVDAEKVAKTVAQEYKQAKEAHKQAVAEWVKTRRSSRVTNEFADILARKMASLDEPQDSGDDV